jgi:hypothetical protein
MNRLTLASVLTSRRAALAHRAQFVRWRGKQQLRRTRSAADGARLHARVSRAVRTGVTDFCGVEHARVMGYSPVPSRDWVVDEGHR